MKSFETSDFNLQVEKLIEEANLFWARGEQNIANHMMKKLLKMVEQVSFYVYSLIPRKINIFFSMQSSYLYRKLAETNCTFLSMIYSFFRHGFKMDITEYLSKTY